MFEVDTLDDLVTKSKCSSALAKGLFCAGSGIGGIGIIVGNVYDNDTLLYTGLGVGFCLLVLSAASYWYSTMAKNEILNRESNKKQDYFLNKNEA